MVGGANYRVFDRHFSAGICDIVCVRDVAFLKNCFLVSGLPAATVGRCSEGAIPQPPGQDAPSQDTEFPLRKRLDRERGRCVTKHTELGNAKQRCSFETVTVLHG